MCVVNEIQYVAKKSFYIYKWVTSNRVSPSNPCYRGIIYTYRDQGVKLKYNPGKIIKSPSGPGIMGYKKNEQQSSWSRSIFRTMILIKLTIRKGTKYRTGFDDTNLPIICAEKVYVNHRGKFSS